MNSPFAKKKPPAKRPRTLLCPALLSLCSLLHGQSATRENKPFDKAHFTDGEGLKAAQAAQK